MTTSTANPSGSYFGAAFGKPVNPLWILRGFGLAVLAALLLGMFVFKSGSRHDFCIGLSVGVLIGLIVQLFALKGVEVNENTQPSDVQDLRLTR